MSHFCVLVIGPDPEEQLAPYHEFECTGVDDEYVQDVDDTEENRADYEKYNSNEGDQVATSFAEWVEDWTGREIVRPGEEIITKGEGAVHKFGYILVDEDGEVIKTIDRTNPNRKWDWYQLGGRWTGFFKLKPGAHGETGSAGLGAKPAKRGYADAALKGDIDFDEMRNEEAKASLEEFDKVVAIINGRPVPDFEAALKRMGEDKLEEARREYWDDPVVRDLNAKHLMPMFESLQETYCNFDRLAFEERVRRDAVVTFAVVKDGKWYERGKMGWWACVSDEKDRNDWHAEFYAMLNELPDDTLLSLYDCHI